MEGHSISRTNSLRYVDYLKISTAYNILSGNSFICSSSLTRLVAKEDSIIKSTISSEGDGVFIPKGVIEFFYTSIGEEIKVISGEINVMSAI